MFKTENIQGNRYCPLAPPPPPKKMSFLIDDKILNTRASVGQGVCRIPAYFSRNKGAVTQNLVASFTAEEQRSA